jgi:hypothetical protein
VYRSPDGDFSTFLRSLESVIQKVQARNKQFILCGEWKINFMHESLRLNDGQELMSLHYLANAARSPTRLTNDTVSLIDVIVPNSIGELATVMDLGYSNHKAQIL